MELDLTNESLLVYKALASETRLEILRFIGDGQKSVGEVAKHLKISNSITTRHIQEMEGAGLLESARGIGENKNKKMVKLKVDNINIRFPEKIYHEYSSSVTDLRLGHYTDFFVQPTCGLATTNEIVGNPDDPKFFMDSGRVDASLLWFARTGFVEYKVPNLLKAEDTAELLEISLEISSEFPISNNIWPSDLTIFVNDLKLAVYTIKGNYSDVRGRYTPKWWPDEFSQYGELIHIRINQIDTGIDGVPYSNIKISDLKLETSPFIKLRFEVEEHAKNKGGLTIFGEKFGNHNQNIKVTTYYTEK